MARVGRCPQAAGRVPSRQLCLPLTVLLPWPRVKGWGSLWLQGRGLPLAMGSGTWVPFGNNCRASHLSSSGSTQEACPFWPCSQLEFQGLPGKLCLLPCLQAVYVFLTVPTPGQPLLGLLASSATTSSKKPSLVLPLPPAGGLSAPQFSQIPSLPLSHSLHCRCLFSWLSRLPCDAGT